MIDPQDLRITSYLPQSGHGAGGMMVGLTTSGIIVHHIPTGIGVSCDSERSQHANKEKALRLLEQLVSRTAETAPDWMAQFPPAIPLPLPPHGVGKVNMIKDVRYALGCGLKEAKDLVDKYYERADCKELCEQEYNGGKCALGDACLCGGDLLSIRKGCYNWVKV